MKKLLTLVLVAFLSSCVAKNQQSLNLNVSIAHTYADIGGNKSINLKVVDGRRDRAVIGSKRFGDGLVVIKSNQNISELVQDKISRDLEQNGFLVSESSNNSTDKFLEVRILTLNYIAYRELVIGSSKIEVLLKITAKNKADGSSYSTTQSFTANKNHFIVPLISTDEKTINKALQESLDGIAANQKLLDFLKN